MLLPLPLETYPKDGVSSIMDGFPSTPGPEEPSRRHCKYKLSCRLVLESYRWPDAHRHPSWLTSPDSSSPKFTAICIMADGSVVVLRGGCKKSLIFFYGDTSKHLAVFFFFFFFLLNFNFENLTT